jgi:hypothetical protein
MGGMVATHLARARKVNFLCADRTFASLYLVVYYNFHRVLSWLFIFFTLWEVDSALNYVEVKCPKICCFDQNDEIIPAIASLAYGIPREVIYRRLHRGPRGRPLQMKNVLRDLDHKLDLCAGRGPASSNFHLRLISPEDFESLHQALDEVFTVLINASTAALRNSKKGIRVDDGSKAEHVHGETDEPGDAGHEHCECGHDAEEQGDDDQDDVDEPENDFSKLMTYEEMPHLILKVTEANASFENA